jgi:hypothetical protein
MLGGWYMAATHPPEYWKALAQQLDAENIEARVYVTHDPSLGLAREAILRKYVMDETPGPFEVRTGLIRHQPSGRNPIVSNQCDLLVYDPHKDPPFYRMENFVVVSKQVASAVVEVKSYLDNSRFGEIINVWRGVAPFGVPVLGFAYDGVTFETFLEYVAAQINTPRELASAAPDIRLVPECIAVHERNYVGFRCRNIEGCCQAWHYFALNFGSEPGSALAFFFQLYTNWLRDQASLWEASLLAEFNRWQGSVSAAHWMVAGGAWQSGPAPDEPISQPN